MADRNITDERETPRRGDMLQALMRQRVEAWARIEVQRRLLATAVDVMASLHRAIEAMEDDPELAGRVPPEALRKFVDALAVIDRERCLLSRDDGPGEEDGPWSEDWEKRRG